MANRSWNTEWWIACSQLTGPDKETEARCVGNAMYEAALARGMTPDRAREHGHIAYRNAGGVTFA